MPRAAKRSRVASGKAGAPSTDTPHYLHDNVLNGAASCRKAAKTWVASFVKPDLSMVSAVDMLNFMFLVCGSKVTPADVAGIDDDAFIEDRVGAVQQHLLDAATDVYPLTDKGAGKVARNVRTFLGAVVDGLNKHNVLEDAPEEGSALNELVSWITICTSSPSRPIRHTATLFCMVLGLEVCKAAADVAAEVVTREKQLESAQGRGRGAARTKQIAQVTADRDALQAKLDALNTVVCDMFASVFHHRYRDVHAPVRSVALELCGEWLAAYPGTPDSTEFSGFLANSYLKYFGWMLSDKEASVRRCTTAALVTLFADADNLPALTPFAMRFMARFVQATGDKDTEVAVGMYDILSVVGAAQLLDPAQVAAARQGLYSMAPAVRRAAGAFVVAMEPDDANLQTVLALGRSLVAPAEGEGEGKGEEEEEGAPAGVLAPGEGAVGKDFSVGDGDGDKRTWDQDGAMEVRPAAVMEYVVDALQGTEWAPLVTDWDAIVALLLSDDDTGLTDDLDQELLLFLASASVRQVAGAAVSPLADVSSTSAGDRAPAAGAGGAAAASTSMAALSAALVPHLATLLTKFRSEPYKVFHVVWLASQLDLGAFTRHKRELKATVRTLCELHAHMSHRVVLRHTAQALRHLSSEAFATRGEAAAGMAALVTQLADVALPLLDADDVSHDGLVELEAALHRLRLLAVSVPSFVADTLADGAPLTDALDAFLTRTASAVEAGTVTPAQDGACVHALHLLAASLFYAVHGVFRAAEAAAAGLDADDAEAAGLPDKEAAALTKAAEDVVPLRDTVLGSLRRYASLLNESEDEDNPNGRRSLGTAFRLLANAVVALKPGMAATYLAPLALDLTPDDAALVNAARHVDNTLRVTTPGAVVPGTVTPATHILAYALPTKPMAMPLLVELDRADVTAALKLALKRAQPHPAALRMLLGTAVQSLAELVVSFGSDSVDAVRIARKLASMLPKDQLALVHMHEEGIKLALGAVPDNLALLEAMEALVRPLQKGSRRLLAKHLAEATAALPVEAASHLAAVRDGATDTALADLDEDQRDAAEAAWQHVLVYEAALGK